MPLDFATRQIVPKTIKVTFGNGVDADEVIIDWRGGQAWPDVLRSALRPAGLQAIFRPGAVLISRSSRF